MPERWPRRVRSAVVHALAIARTSLVLARANTENHFDARIRLRTEVDRLQQEVALLREEIRIKDARMERLPPQHRVIVVALRRESFRRELEAHVDWFNADRPHTFLRGAAPDEVYFRRMPACRRPRLEPRERWPRRLPCARPHALVRGRPLVAAMEVAVEARDGCRHLAVVTLRLAA